MNCAFGDRRADARNAGDDRRYDRRLRGFPALSEDGNKEGFG